MNTAIRVGPAGWSYSDWKGVVYPAVRPRGFHEAAFLAQYFPVIEINTSFYRPLRPELGRVWARKVEEHRRFQFTAKLYRGFTHDGRVERAEVRQFCEGLTPLADAGRLGALLMQFPWSFRFSRENRNHLVQLQKAFGQYPLVAEMRHASWNQPDALRVFEDRQIGFCNIDQPQLNQCLPPTAHVTSPVGYVRLHGRNYQEWFNFDEDPARHGGLTAAQARYNYLYSTAQLEKWKTRIEQIADQARTTYVITNNHFQGKAVVNGLQVMEMISGEPADVPPQLLEHYPELQPIAANAPAQRRLFPSPRPKKIGRSLAFLPGRHLIAAASSDQARR